MPQTSGVEVEYFFGQQVVQSDPLVSEAFHWLVLMSDVQFFKQLVKAFVGPKELILGADEQYDLQVLPNSLGVGPGQRMGIVGLENLRVGIEHHLEHLGVKSRKGLHID